MQRRAGPRRRDAATDRVVIMRVAAPIGPHEPLHGRRHMRLEVLAGGAFRSEAVHAGFRLVAVDERADVVGLRLDGDERRAVGHRRVRPQERERVGELAYADAHVAHDGLAPLLLQVAAVGEHGVAGHVGRVESGCADDDVAFVRLAIVADAAVFGEGGHTGVNYVDVFLLECLGVFPRQ